MTKYLFGLIGLALLAGSPVLGQAATCGGECGCCEQGGCNACGKTCGKCCPQCGCCLVPICHVYCVPKTITEHKYCCICEDKCIPGPSCGCKKCGCGCGECGCDSCNNGCEECCGHCKVREINKLVIHPCVKEVPVRKCTVEWVCPNCSNCGQCGATSAPAAPNAAPPAPSLPKAPPPPKTADLAPLPPVSNGAYFK